MKKFLIILMISVVALSFFACDDSEEEDDVRGGGETTKTYPLNDTLWQVSEVGSGFDGAFSESEIWVFSGTSDVFTVYNTATKKYSKQKVVINKTDSTMTLWETKVYDYTHSLSGGTLVIASQINPSTTYVNFEVSSLTASDLDSYTESSSRISKILLMMKTAE